ncbi:MAG: hypothetical protein ACK6BG_11660 [Cyanobacteriota bacterium]
MVSSRNAIRIQRPRGRRRRDPAHLMPLAAGGAGLLLLLGLTLQGLALQERAQVSAQERLRREEDLLISGAHQLLAALNSRHRCLLALPLARWGDAAGAGCASPEAQANLRRMVVWSAPVRLGAWQPGMDGQSAELELLLDGGAGRAERRGRFAVRLAGAPPQAVDLRSRGLGAVLP